MTVQLGFLIHARFLFVFLFLESQQMPEGKTFLYLSSGLTVLLPSLLCVVLAT